MLKSYSAGACDSKLTGKVAEGAGEGERDLWFSSPGIRARACVRVRGKAPGSGGVLICPLLRCLAFQPETKMLRMFYYGG